MVLQLSPHWLHIIFRTFWWSSHGDDKWFVILVILSTISNDLTHLKLSLPHRSCGQLVSSSPFAQSGNPSQTYDLERHLPASHINWFGKHRSTGTVGVRMVVDTVLLGHPASSAPLLQSLKPSHFHQYGTHRSLPQWNIQSWHVGAAISVLWGGSVAVWQFSSSRPFWQSLSPSKQLNEKTESIIKSGFYVV